MPGIGRRKDGWPNRDLNVGAIIAVSPVLSADKKSVYQSWSNRIGTVNLTAQSTRAR
jgi:hypothetical protein